jgi:HK97 family phage portal protein
MGFRSGLGGLLRAAADTLGGGQPSDPLDPRWWQNAGGSMSIAGISVTERRVSQLGAVQSVRFGLSGAMSSLPFMVFRRGPNNSRTALPDHPLSILLGRRPNWRQTAAEFIGEIAWHLSYWRRAYVVIRPGGDYAIGALEIKHPRTWVKTELRDDGRIYYTFRAPGASVSETFRDDEIWHLRGNPVTEDGLEGEGIWVSAREVFGRALAVHDYGDLWFKNFGATGGTLKHPGTFKDKQDKLNFLDTWREGSLGPNRHRDRLLTHGAEYVVNKITNAEAQLLETERAADTDIFGLWSFPPHRAGRLEKSSFSNIEQMGQEFVTYGLAPPAIGIEQGAERDLLLDNDDGKLFCEFNFAGLLRGDLLSRYRAYLIGRQGEWLSANDILRKENENPRADPEGDEYKNPLTKDSADGQGTRSGNDTGNDGSDGGAPDKKPGDDGG